MPTRMTRIQKSYSNRSGEKVKKSEPSCTTGRNIKWYSHFGRQVVSQMFKHSYHMIRQFPSWVYISKINENVCLHKNFYMDAYSCNIYNNQNLETTRMSNRQIDEQNVIYPYNGILFEHKKESY